MELFGYWLFFMLSHVYVVGVNTETRYFLSTISSSSTIHGNQADNDYISPLHTTSDIDPNTTETSTVIALNSSPKPTENNTVRYLPHKLIQQIYNTSSENVSGDFAQTTLSPGEYPSSIKFERVSTKENPSSKNHALNTTPYKSTPVNIPKLDDQQSSQILKEGNISTEIRHSTDSYEKRTTPSTVSLSSLSSETTTESLAQSSPSSKLPSDTTTMTGSAHVSHISVTKSDPRKFPIPYFVRKDDWKAYHNKHRQHTSVFKHHLQIVPMIDTEYEPAIIKNHRYLLSVLIPLGVGAVGAILIAMTVLTLRHIARKRPHLENPFDDYDEVDAGRIRPKSRIASICSESNDKAFLLMGEQDDE